MTNPSSVCAGVCAGAPADRNRATKLALGVLRIYRKILSPMIMGLYGPACRFEPSCSEYASQAIGTHGVMRGFAMAARRLARCHPLGGHGHDPVPARAQSGRE
jgi:putative membrane protein insertion efficiency factor